jgi:3-hydroxyacyl-CoA dehydrogenase
VARALTLAKRLGKVGVVVGNAFGFVGNRLMLPYMYEAQFLVEEGATPQQVDRVLTDFGMAMGIFAVDDMAGLDVAWRVRQAHPPFPSGQRQPLVADVLCEMGRFGQKTKAGWYRYSDGRTPEPDPEVLSLIERRALDAGISRRAVSDEEIADRLVLTLVNEGARVLEEGVALRAADIDVIYVTGYGFPAFRGGPMFHAGRRGLADVLARIQAFRTQHGDRWQPAPLLERLAPEGSTFREYDAARSL